MELGQELGLPAGLTLALNAFLGFCLMMNLSFKVFEGHTHYVMQIVINPKDNNTFASASLDRTVKVNKLH